MDVFPRRLVERALWRVFREPGSKSLAPTVFKNRIKKLIDLDRQIDGFPDREHARAFFDYDPQARGADIQFTRQNVYTIGIGLTLLDAGFSQASVVHFMKYCRSCNEIYTTYDRIFAQGNQQGDWRVYLVTHTMRLAETWGADPKSEIIFIPETRYGMASLMGHFEHKDERVRSSLVFEIAALCLQVDEELTRLLTED